MVVQIFIALNVVMSFKFLNMDFVHSVSDESYPLQLLLQTI